jgi:hypothetical protein
MSQRTRSVSWCEGRILEVLAKSKPNNLPCPLALSAMAMKFEIRDLQEQHNYDIALFNLLKKGVIIQIQDEKGFDVLKLAA